MPYESEDIAKALKAARINKGLSQRALSQRAGLPQAQISKIEGGAVDLRLSSLIALARALDLEAVLVPRTALPAVQSIIRSTTHQISSVSANAPTRPAYTLDDEASDG